MTCSTQRRAGVGWALHPAVLVIIRWRWSKRELAVHSGRDHTQAVTGRAEQEEKHEGQGGGPAHHGLPDPLISSICGSNKDACLEAEAGREIISARPYPRTKKG